MLEKACPRCGKWIPYGKTYCDDCAPIMAAIIERNKEDRSAKRRKRLNKAYNRRRDPKYTAFYNGKDWERLSEAYKAAHDYQCEAKLPGCQKIGVEVHHKQPIQTPEGWERRYDWDNLELVCTSCHNRRHPDRFKQPDEPGVIDLTKISQK